VLFGVFFSVLGLWWWGFWFWCGSGGGWCVSPFSSVFFGVFVSSLGGFFVVVFPFLSSRFFFLLGVLGGWGLYFFLCFSYLAVFSVCFSLMGGGLFFLGFFVFLGVGGGFFFLLGGGFVSVCSFFRGGGWGRPF